MYLINVYKYVEGIFGKHVNSMALCNFYPGLLVICRHVQASVLHFILCYAAVAYPVAQLWLAEHLFVVEFSDDH